MPKPTPEYFKSLKEKIDKQDPSNRMRWRRESEYHIRSDAGFFISRVGGVYTCWAPGNYRVGGVKTNTGYIGFYFTEDGEAAKEACQELFADPENFVPPEDRRIPSGDSRALESSCAHTPGPARIHRHSGPGGSGDYRHPDLFEEWPSEPPKEGHGTP